MTRNSALPFLEQVLPLVSNNRRGRRRYIARIKPIGYTRCRKWERLMVKQNALRSSVFGLLMVTLAGGASPTPPAGFELLFNGQDLSGWKVPAGDNGHWKVIDGVIDYDAGSESKSDKSLWTDREYGDFVLQIDWRLKEAPFINKNIPYILPDGTHAKDITGKEMRMALPDADSGVFLRGDGFYQVNMWCWPIGSGEVFSVRTDRKTPAEVRAAVTPRSQADKPVGEWNHFEITVKGKTLNVVLNGKTVIPTATIPTMPDRGRLALQHHGGKNKEGAWTGPPSLVQFKNIYIKELPADTGVAASDAKPVRALVITGGHDHETSFYGLFDRYKDLGRVPVAASTTAFQNDLRSKYDVVIMYDFSRDLDEKGKKNLRDFVESGKGVVVLHHALLNYQKWNWWYQDAVGGSYRLSREGEIPSSTVKNDQDMLITPEGSHPITAGLSPFHVVDETYGRMWISPSVHPLLSTNNPNSTQTVAWISPLAGAKVVAIQLGHGPAIFGHPSYRALVHNAILWTAGRIK
jgi:type 1 glutamine amidotransferase